MLLNAVGELGNLLALGFAPASVVTPVGAVGVVFNAIFASLFLKEPFRKIDMIGLVLIVTGIVVVVLCSKESNVQLSVSECIDAYFNRAAFYIYVALLCGSCAWCISLYKRGLGTKYMSMSVHTRTLCTLCIFTAHTCRRYILLCSLISSVTVLACKVAVGWVAMSGQGKNQFNHVLFYVAWLAVIVSAVVSVHYLQQAMQHFGNNQVVPVYYATFTLACVVGAAVVYKELDGSPADKLTGFFIGILVAFGGVFAIGMRRKGKASAEEHQERDRTNLLSDQDIPSESSSIEMQSATDLSSELPASQKKPSISKQWGALPRRLSLSVSGMDLDLPEVCRVECIVFLRLCTRSHFAARWVQTQLESSRLKRQRIPSFLHSMFSAARALRSSLSPSRFHPAKRITDLHRCYGMSAFWMYRCHCDGQRMTASRSAQGIFSLGAPSKRTHIHPGTDSEALARVGKSSCCRTLLMRCQPSHSGSPVLQQTSTRCLHASTGDCSCSSKLLLSSLIIIFACTHYCNGQPPPKVHYDYHHLYSYR
jgi:drug/metabolite transporter (DMT)-like permease